MKFTSKLLTVFLFTSLFATGCSKQVVEKQIVYQREPGAPKSEFDDGGYHGGGGGNCVGEENKNKCRPIESFRVQLLDKDIIKNDVMDILETTSEFYPQLAGDLYHKISQRMWYFVPIELKKLPGSIIGAPVNVENLGQIAIQNEQEIWMDNKLFESLSPEDQVRILIHEFVMGIRIMEYSTKSDTCIANASYLLYEDKEDQYKKESEKCYSNSQFDTLGKSLNPIFGDKIDLKDKDYRAVRTLTNWILDGFENVSKDRVTNYLKEYFHREYKK
ncbi:MAG: hypothetical protein KDD34_01275 [Bdellovibrionales bacterium]|nr:hypothetical protein [Bdellovibrionales bacterium]